MAMGLDLSCTIIALEFIKKNHGLIGDEEKEANYYIDYLLDLLKVG